MPSARKPIKHGLGFVIVDEHPRLFTIQGAQRYADNAAKRSGMRGAVGLVSDCGDYWRVNVAADPFKGWEVRRAR